jgi:hypothetical protein
MAGIELLGTFKVLIREISTPAQAGAIIRATYGAFTATAKGNHMAYTMPVDAKVAMRVDYVDAHDNPARVDGAVTWTSSDPTVVSVVADSKDTQNALITAAGKLGAAQITAEADADLGDGVRELLTLLDITVVAGEAVAGVIAPVQVQPAKK